MPPARPALPQPWVFRSAAAWGGSAAKKGSGFSCSLVLGCRPPLILYFFLGAGGLSGVAGGRPEPHVERLLEMRVCGGVLGRRRKRVFLRRWRRGCLWGPLQRGRARQALRPRIAAGAGVSPPWFGARLSAGGTCLCPGPPRWEPPARSSRPPAPYCRPLSRCSHSPRCPRQPLILSPLVSIFNFFFLKKRRARREGSPRDTPGQQPGIRQRGPGPGWAPLCRPGGARARPRRRSALPGLAAPRRRSMRRYRPSHLHPPLLTRPAA